MRPMSLGPRTLLATTAVCGSHLDFDRLSSRLAVSIDLAVGSATTHTTSAYLAQPKKGWRVPPGRSPTTSQRWGSSSLTTWLQACWAF